MLHIEIRNKLVYIFMLVLCFISFIIAFSSVYQYMQKSRTHHIVAEQKGLRITEQAAQKIDSNFAALQVVAEKIAFKIRSGKLKTKDFQLELSRSLQNNPEMFGIGISYFPRENEDDLRVKSPYYVTYHSKKNITSDSFIKIINVPFYHMDPQTGQKIITGYVFIDYPRESIERFISESNVGKYGYSYILDKNGTFISYPINTVVQNKKTIFQLSAELNNKALKEAGEKAIYGHAGFTAHFDEISGEESWIFYVPIHATSWSLNTVFVKEFFAKSKKEILVEKVSIEIKMMVFLILFLTVIFRPSLRHRARTWVWSALISVVLVLGILFTWYFALTLPAQKIIDDVQITDAASLNNFKNLTSQTTKVLYNVTPLYIPTGIHVNAIEFVGLQKVKLTGYIWQKISKSLVGKKIIPGVMFIGASSVNEKEIFAHNGGDEKIIGWSFQVLMPQNLNYFQYPFDKKVLKLKLAPKAFEDNVILTPDLKGYTLINPSYAPGIQRDSLHGWKIQKSYFNYTDSLKKYYSKNLGLISYLNAYPSLNFTALLQRDFLPPLVIVLLPILLINTVLFIMLIESRNVPIYNMLTVCSGLLLTAILAHTKLKTDINVKDIIFFEYFYVMTYLSCLFILINGFFVLYMKKHKVNIDRVVYITQILYLPCLMVFMCLLSIILLL